jgi:PKD domain
VGGQAGQAGGVNLHIASTRSVTWCSQTVILANRDIPDGTQFPISEVAGSPTENTVSDAISVHRLLELVGVAPQGVTSVVLHRDDGTLSRLGTTDLEDPSPSFENDLLPLVMINGTITQYLRPLRSPNDANGGDQIVASGGAALDVYVYSGPVLSVRIRASRTTATKGQPVTFTGHVSGATPTDGRLSYAWNFGDGTHGRTGVSVTHTFTASGTYPVVLSVTGANGSGGVSRSVTIGVGSAPKAAGPGQRTRGTSSQRRSAGTGPQQSNGQTPGGSSGGPSSNGSQGSNAQSGTNTPSNTKSVAARDGTQHSHSSAQGPTTPHRQATARGTGPGVVVNGRLIAYVTPVPASQLINPAARTRPVHAPPTAAPATTSPFAAAGGICAIILLLGAGAGTEARSRRRSLSAVAGG